MRNRFVPKIGFSMIQSVSVLLVSGSVILEAGTTGSKGILNHAVMLGA